MTEEAEAGYLRALIWSGLGGLGLPLPGSHTAEANVCQGACQPQTQTGYHTL